MTGSLEVRAASAADVREFYGKLPPQTIRAKVLERDGEVVGVAGYYVGGPTAVVFSDAKEGIPKIRIWREAVKFMRELNLPALCVATPGSEAFLQRLGWTFAGLDDGKEVYRWQP